MPDYKYWMPIDLFIFLKKVLFYFVYISFKATRPVKKAQIF